MGDLGNDRTLSVADAASAATDGAAFTVGAHVGGRYEIVRYIAAGGMGEVYEAQDRMLGTRVALKAMREAHAGSDAALDRFKREIALARKVTHANVCRVHDVGEHAGRAFLTMELLGGETLAERLKGGALPEAEVERIAPQLVAALGALHSAGVVHRDFKSSNVMLDGDRVIVTDFGLARSTEPIGDERLTADATLLGTPAYMAPEQVDGRETTAASDIYALGVVLYEMTTGKLPFSEKTPLATATARLIKDPPVPDTSPRWQGAIMRCLERAPEDRPRRVEDVIGARRRRRVGLALAAGGGLVAIAAGVAVAFSGGDDRTSSECPPAARRLEGIWDPATRARIAARFEASALEHVGDTGRAIVAELDAQSASWARLWDGACTSTDRIDNPLLHAQRLTCADHRLVELRAHSEVLADPAVDVHEVSLGYIGELRLKVVSDCESVKYLRAQSPAPAAQKRDAIEALMLTFHRARVRMKLAVNVGVIEGVDEAAAEMVRVKRELLEQGYPTGAAEVVMTLADGFYDLGRSEEANALYDEAIAIAEENADDVTLAVAEIDRAWARVEARRDYDETAVAAQFARAAQLVVRIGEPDSVRNVFDQGWGAFALRRRRLDEVIAAWTQAFTAMERIGRPGLALDFRGFILGLRSWNEDPRGLIDEAKSLAAERERLAGAAHPRFAAVLVRVADVHYRTGDIETALRDVERAIRIYEASLEGRTSTLLANAYLRAYIYAHADGVEDGGARYLEAYVALAREQPGADASRSAYADAADLTAAEGARQAAEYAARRAIEAARTPAERAAGYEELADLHLETGEPFADESWEDRLAELRPENRHAILAQIAASQGRATDAQVHVDALPEGSRERAITEGIVALGLGRPEHAIEPFRRARELAQDSFAWSSTEAGAAAAFLGIALQRSGDAAGAIEPLEEALWVMGVCCGQRSVWTQDARFALAQALRDTGGDRARSRRLATQAHQALIAMGPSLAKKAAKVTAWLESHR